MLTPLLRKAVLATAEQDAVERLIRQGSATRKLVRRFVAGDTIDDALSVGHVLAAQGMTTTFDRLGENVRTAEEAHVAAADYEATLRALATAGLEPHISVKLTMLGLDLSENLALENMRGILETAASVSGFVCIDMESSAYTTRTLAIATALHDTFPGEVGTVIQAYLYRSDRDLERLIARGVRVRLVKGAYAEPATVAWQRPREIDGAFVRLMERLLEAGRSPAIATHDPALIRATRGFALRLGIDPARWEFQMLYGVRRDEQRELVRAAYQMRIYVPFGTDWYPYFARRIAERPANALFVLRQLAPW